MCYVYARTKRKKKKGTVTNSIIKRTYVPREQREAKRWDAELRRDVYYVVPRTMDRSDPS